MSLASWLSNLWPFVSKSAHRAALLREKSHAVEAVRIADEAVQRGLSMQRHVSDWLGAYDRWNNIADKIIRLVEDRCCVATFTCPELSFRTMFDRNGPVTPTFAEEQVKLVRLAIDIGLSRECPPELVAKKIASAVETAILKKWQSQSILLADGMP